VNHWNRRIALAAVLAAFSAPAFAADPAKDCTVCRDPLWPNLDNLMPAIPLNGPAVTNDAVAASSSGDSAWLVANYRSPGVGAAAAGSKRGTVYADPTWPTSTAAADGVGVSGPSAPVAPPRAAPAKPAVASN